MADEFEILQVRPVPDDQIALGVDVSDAWDAKKAAMECHATQRGFTRATAEDFDQVLLFGAGFDTRALRFQAEARQAHIFELDAPPTQQAKNQQYRRRKLGVPHNLVFIAMDFDKDSLPERLDQSGFARGRKSLFILEGLVMYLESGSVWATLRTIQEYAGAGSMVKRRCCRPSRGSESSGASASNPLR